MHYKNIIGFKWVTNFDNERLNIYLLAIELYNQKYYRKGIYHIDDEAFDMDGRIVKNYKGFYISKDMNFSDFWTCLIDANKGYIKNLKLLPDFITIEEMIL